MINVELQECEAFAKLAEYQASQKLNDLDNSNQAQNKLKLSLINQIGEVNYYQLIQSEEFQNLYGVISRRIELVNAGRSSGYASRFKEALKKTYDDEYRYKRKLQRVWFGRGGWALRGA